MPDLKELIRLLNSEDEFSGVPASRITFTVRQLCGGRVMKRSAGGGLETVQCVCARGCINSKAVSKVPQDTTPSLLSLLYYMYAPAMSTTKNPVRISPLTFFPILDVLARICRDCQSVSKSPGTKTKGLRRSNFASAGSTRPKEGGIKANIPRLREQIASYRVSERKKSLEIGNCTRFSRL
jgi:hypothetical protein